MERVYEAVNATPKAIVIRCFDRRFRKAHKGFIRDELKLRGEDFWPIKRAGGIAALARPRQMKADFASLTSEIEFLVAHSPTVQHIILINHQDCKRYDKLVEREPKKDPEREDLDLAIRLLERKYPKLEISAYYARFVDADRSLITFDAVKESVLRMEMQVA